MTPASRGTLDFELVRLSSLRIAQSWQQQRGLRFLAGPYRTTHNGKFQLRPGATARLLEGAGAAHRAGLNDRKVPTARGTGQRSALQVARVMERAKIPAVAVAPQTTDSDRWIETEV
jgi:hypothetical protein